MCSASADDFSGTDRFAVESRLGAGSFGVVYRAYDRKRETVVALKTCAAPTRTRCTASSRSSARWPTSRTRTS